MASAWVSAVASSMLLASVSFAACASATPLSSFSRLVIALNRACDDAEVLNPASWSEPPGEIATGCVVAPAPSSAFPATEKNTGKFEELIFCDSM